MRHEIEPLFARGTVVRTVIISWEHADGQGIYTSGEREKNNTCHLPTHQR